MLRSIKTVLRGARPKRGLVALLILALAISGCASFGDDGAMTPSERRLKESTSRFYETVGTGAVFGAVVGAILGAALGGKNRGAAAALGASLGALAGGGAGSYIAQRNQNAGNTEAALNARIEAAQREVQNYREIAASAQLVAEENRAKLAELDGRFRKGEVTAAQYRQEARDARAAQDRIAKALANARGVSTGLSQDAATSGGVRHDVFERSRSEMAELQQSLAQSQATLAQALAGVPG